MTKRALVLGGGGPVGIAWETGLISGLARAGVDLGQADFIVGTSAGSFVGARLAMGADAASMVDPILVVRAEPAPAASPTPPRPAADLSMLTRKMAEAQSGARPAAEVRAEIGAWALEARTVDEDTYIQSFGRSFASLPEDTWPTRGFACTAVDAVDGEFKLWTSGSGVGLVRAVASSCSVPGVYPPITIKGRRYIDGGMRSGTNADVARGYGLVVVVAVRVTNDNNPIAERSRAVLDTEIAALKASGAEVIVLTPDAGSQAALGLNLMDFAQRRPAAEAGLAQGRAEAARLAAAWG